MRPIDADALTEDFKGRIDPCDKWIKEANEETKPRAEATRAFINEVILTIQDAPTIEPDRPHGEWIPCSERLPEDEGKYLVSLNYGDVTMDSFIDGMFIMNLINVVAWMPLPEPYKKEG